MRKPGEIRQKLKQVKFRYLSKLVKAKLARRPGNCLHNGELDLPKSVHICTLKLEDGSWNGGVCDEEHGGLERAHGCPHFQPRQSKDEIKESFYSFFKTSEFGEIAYLYPMAAGLIWALGEDTTEDVGDDGAGEEDPEPEAPSEVPLMPNAETMGKLSPEGETEDALAATVNQLSEQVAALSESQISTATVNQIVSKAISKEPDHGARLDDLSTSINRRFKALPDHGARIDDLTESVDKRFSNITDRLDATAIAEAPKKWWQRLLGA